jgi:Lipocalin-like domain
MKRLAVSFFCLLLLSLSASASENQVLGTWKLQSFVREVIATGQRFAEFGEKPDGYISYLPDGRMFATIVADNRVKPGTVVPTDEEKIKLFGTMIAYAGTYTAEGDKIVHHVDISWNQIWTGTEQVRFYKIDDDMLTITTAKNRNPRDGQEGRAILVFKKVR